MPCPSPTARLQSAVKSSACGALGAPLRSFTHSLYRALSHDWLAHICPMASWPPMTRRSASSGRSAVLCLQCTGCNPCRLMGCSPLGGHLYRRTPSCLTPVTPGVASHGGTLLEPYLGQGRIVGARPRARNTWTSAWRPAPPVGSDPEIASATCTGRIQRLRALPARVGSRDYECYLHGPRLR